MWIDNKCKLRKIKAPNLAPLKLDVTPNSLWKSLWHSPKKKWNMKSLMTSASCWHSALSLFTNLAAKWRGLFTVDYLTAFRTKLGNFKRKRGVAKDYNNRDYRWERCSTDMLWELLKAGNLARLHYACALVKRIRVKYELRQIWTLKFMIRGICCSSVAISLHDTGHPVWTLYSFEIK